MAIDSNVLKGVLKGIIVVGLLPIIYFLQVALLKRPLSLRLKQPKPVSSERRAAEERVE